MPLADVLKTPLLTTREPSCARQRRRQKMRALAELSALSIVNLTEAARGRCQAQSAGVSLFRHTEPIASQWITAVGKLSEFRGSSFPLRHSLCGVAAELHSTQLFIQPQRYFKWIEHAGVYISEALVTPMSDASGRCFGTVWVMSHRGARPRFDEEDARALEAIAGTISLALLPAGTRARSYADLPDRDFHNGKPSPTENIDSTGPSKKVILPRRSGV
jgi:putative methionine-R-sulfoxide reductase with GAF domain